MRFANTLLHSMGCLFTVLVVAFKYILKKWMNPSIPILSVVAWTFSVIAKKQLPNLTS